MLQPPRALQENARRGRAESGHTLGKIATMVTLTRDEKKAWRDENQAWRVNPPTREQLVAAAALCHLVYWWRGPEHRSWEDLQRDSSLQQAPEELAPPSEAAGGGVVYEFQDRDQVHRCVKTVMASVHGEATIVLWDSNLKAAVLREPKRIIVFFRGTVDVHEMVKDARLYLVPFKVAGRDVMRVHCGFKAHVEAGGAYERVLGCVFAVAEEMHKATEPFEILLTGHSLGAAAATLLAPAIDAKIGAFACSITLVTFGSPRVGNRAFAAAIDSSLRLRHWRVQNELDVVTRLPWWLPFPMLYQHTGHHIWLANGKVTWQPDGAIHAASRPMNVFAYPFRWMFNRNAADIRVHQMGGKFTRGYCIHLDKFDWSIPPPAKKEERL